MNQRRVTWTIHASSVLACAAAAVLSPIPLADEAALIPILGVMAQQIGRAHGLAFRDIPWRQLGATATKALIARGVANLAVSLVPGVAGVANAVSAFAITESLGRRTDAACAEVAAGSSSPASPPAVRTQLGAV